MPPHPSPLITLILIPVDVLQHVYTCLGNYDNQLVIVFIGQAHHIFVGDKAILSWP